MLIRKFYSPEEKSSSDVEEIKKESHQAKSETKPDTAVADLTKALKEARENTVSKAEYERMKAERDAVVAQIIDGANPVASGQQTAPQKPDIEELRKKLYGSNSKNLTNLETVSLSLQLREAIIERDGIEHDPFVPLGANIKPTEEDSMKAQHTAKLLQECVDEAHGDSGVFTAKLQSMMANDSVALTNRLNKLGIKYK